MPLAVVEAAACLVEALVSVDPDVLSGPDCATLTEQLAVVEKSCAALRARVAARAAACGAHRERGYADPTDWLARTTGVSRGEAKAVLSTAAALDSLPEAKAAVVSGELSLSQAREVVLAASERPESAAELIALAKNNSLQSLRDEGRRRRLAAVDPTELRGRQLAAREFRHWRDDTGMVCFRGALPPETGIAFVNRLEAECDRVRRRARHQGSTEPRAAHAADALVQLLDGAGRGRGRSADVVIVCDINAWRRGVTAEGEVCHLVGGGPIPVDVARLLAHDAFIKVAIHDGVAIHTVCHFGRHIPAELRAALDLGPPPRFDGIACADGCGSKYGLQWDHVDPIANHGPTSYANLQPRCFSCHAEKTERDRQVGLLRGAGTRPSRPP